MLTQPAASEVIETALRSLGVGPVAARGAAVDHNGRRASFTSTAPPTRGDRRGGRVASS
jgi:hypothetical protein